MDEHNMANTQKTYTIDGIKFRTIPGFSSYGISSNGHLANVRTNYILTPKDFNHYTGRYNLTDNRGKKRTRSALALVSSTYSERTARQFEMNCRADMLV